VQLTRQPPPAALAAGLCLAWASASAASLVTEEPKAGSLLRLFTDSDRVAVRSLMGDYSLALPRAMTLAVHWNNERVIVPAIDAAVGSQEAVDAITTASRPISGNAFQDFVKVRNEFTSELSRGGAALDY